MKISYSQLFILTMLSGAASIIGYEIFVDIETPDQSEVVFLTCDDFDVLQDINGETHITIRR